MYQKLNKILIVAFLITFGSQSVLAQKNKKNIQKLPLEQRIDSLMALMTLEEKVGQMNQYNGFWEITGPAPKDGEAAKKYEHLKKGWVGSMLNVVGVKDVKAIQKIAVEETRLGIPLLFGYDVIHGYKTISPIPLAEAASWDLEAIKKSAEMAAEEASAVGINWTFAPMVDISRDARWGRVMEGAGEDTFLGSKIGVARVEGFQGKDFSGNNNILACAKHFAGYGFSEAGRDYNTVDVGTSTLHNILLPPFKAVLEANVRTFMNSFNELNGIPATGNSYLQRDILKGEWNFDGLMVSDWGSMFEMIAHGYAKDRKHAAEIAANAGSDMDMESYVYVDFLAQLVREGKVSESIINDAVRRILRVKFELGLFENPYKYCDEKKEKTVVESKKIRDAALDMAKKSIVLLKNEQQLLPLKKSGLNIAVIGALANDKSSPLGSWRGASKDGSAISVLEGLQNYKGNKITYAKGADLYYGTPVFGQEIKINESDKSGFTEAKKIAMQNDVVIMVLGEVGFQSGEGRSRTNLDLPGVQQQLLEAIYEVNKNIILVLKNGRPLTISWAAEHIPAIVVGWQLGTESGNAIAQVLYGDYNPSGKLPMTFPRNVGQVPIYYNQKNTGRPVMQEEGSVFWTHYIDESNSPLFPFGYGLSYSDFKYTNLELSTPIFHENESLTVTVTIHNNSPVEGKEVVQLYLRDLVGSVTRPVKELKGFELVHLKPYETRQITFTIDAKLLEFYTANEKWETESGSYKVMVGGSSDTVLEADFEFLK